MAALRLPNMNFRASHSFPSNYLPIIPAVSYSILWSWIDLDVKRLEPYFQMSRIEGAPPSRSILIRYPFDFAVCVIRTYGSRPSEARTGNPSWMNAC